MIALMELATTQAIRPALPEGAITVGVRIEVDHLKAVPAGVTVTAVSKLVEVNGRRLIFEVEARSGALFIGRGRIFHAIVHYFLLPCRHREKIRCALITRTNFSFSD